MFVSGMNPFSSLAFSFPTLIITIPATIIVLIWIGSLYGSKLRINSASLFALGFISMFVAGGVSGFFLAQPSIDIMLHATYFVVGHFHMVMAVAAIFGIFAGTYFWFPKMTGRMMNETLGKIHFWLSFVGAYCIFMPFHYLGIAANVRRYQAFVDDYLQPLIPVHRFITVAAIATGVAQFIFLYNLIHSRFWGKPAPDNPWEATSLEWSTPTPPPFDNFGGKHPVVYHDPYQYGVQSSTGDYVMQASSEQVATRARREVNRRDLSLTGVWTFMATTVHEPPKIEPRRQRGRRQRRLAQPCAGGWRPAGRAGLLSATREHRHLGGVVCHHHDLCGADQRVDRAQGLIAGLAELYLAVHPLPEYGADSVQQRHPRDRAASRRHVYGGRCDSRVKVRHAGST